MTKHLWILLMCTVIAQATVKIIIPVNISDETYILAAMDAQVRQKYEVASQYFKYLYLKTGQKEYLYDSLRMYESIKDSSVFSSVIKESLSDNPEDKMLLRFQLISLLKEGKYSEASLEALLLSRQTKESTDYLLSAEALLKLGNYQSGYSELKKAYEISYDEETADRIALLMYTQLDKKQEAITFLKDHISTHGNS